jgi:hypothetical protein
MKDDGLTEVQNRAQRHNITEQYQLSETTVDPPEFSLDNTFQNTHPDFPRDFRLSWSGKTDTGSQQWFLAHKIF